ncbi:MAG: hypothetical protein H0X17_16095 [Deltaproteobacteria bacterium]|nr:hypothetical protein [Deltaproteobacteria bacterium]
MNERLLGALLVVVVGCAGRSATEPPQPPATPDAATSPDATTLARCSTGDTPEIKFAQPDACANDGGVEFCAPDNDPALLSTLASISSAITCAPGGGRARCTASPGLLLCSYPTAVPIECVTPHGAMTDPAWADLCEIAALPQVTAIVHTIYE